MSAVSKALGISRSHLSESLRKEPPEPRVRGREDDAKLLERIRMVVKERPSNGYRRMTARLEFPRKSGDGYAANASSKVVGSFFDPPPTKELARWMTLRGVSERKRRFVCRAFG